ncbi:MAG: NADH-quinone oxidoreductase subunit J [Neisseriaceae bacterium]|nr:NADH-quinone oxidoreductase subunit J [Neisseriaceae bacterium]MBQ9259637.1 NADH-quinone oxidoreductase subunit J [Neisseriaceae bacterium]MBR1818873.1 NADH-quinone oxidoreductase subunit J [Neisseriaceae bacterium]
MMLQITLFYIFAAIILFSGLKVVTAKHPVHAALWLVLTFWTSACTWVLMQAEFLGIVLVSVYVGAVMVLFLFVVMMLNVDIEAMRAGFWRHLPVSLVVGLLMAVVLILVLVSPETKLSAIGELPAKPADYSSVKALGQVLYTDYLLPFELAAVLLVLGMVAAIALVQRHTNRPKYIAPSDQIAVNPKDRMRLVKMQAVVEKEPEPVAEETQEEPQK